jgi:predicted DNA-binding ribbon-helix-helix protein
MCQKSRLVNRSVITERGRTSIRLEPELWDALYEICPRENVGLGELIRQIDARGYAGGRTSAVRVFIVQYFRAAATEKGHSAAGHGQQSGHAVTTRSRR